MDELQNNPRVNDDAADEQQEESRNQQNAAVFTARQLANPRRIRL